MRTFTLLLAILCLLVAQVTFGANPRTMKVDYYHTGNSETEIFSLDRVVLEPLEFSGNLQQPPVHSIIEISVDRIMDSCGYDVPNYEFQKDRDSFENYYGSKSAEFIDDYRRTRNAPSLDGLPGLEFPDEDAGV